MLFGQNSEVFQCSSLTIGGCCVQPVDSNVETSAHDLTCALYSNNYDDIHRAVESGVDMDKVMIDGVSQNPILYLGET